jgi:hypothetical protein
MAAFRLFNALDDDFEKTFYEHEKQFLDIQSSRNHSYLAHGLKSSKEKTYIDLRDFILSLGIFSISDAPIFLEISV